MNFEYGPVDDLDAPAVPRTDPNAGIEQDWTWGDAFLSNVNFWILAQTSEALARASTRPTGQPGATDAEPFNENVGFDTWCQVRRFRHLNW